MDTREKILNVAERLFAEKSFVQVSVRDIVREAEVNLGAINYHFGSKEELIFSIIHRRVQGINDVRLTRLAEVEAREEYTVVDVVSAFVEPPFELAQTFADNHNFARLFGQISTGLDPVLKQRVVDEFEPTLRQFLIVLKQILPRLTPEKLKRYLYFSIGAMSFTLLNSSVPNSLVTKPSNDPAYADMCADLISFVAAGLQHG